MNKETFTSAINGLMVQQDLDFKHADAMSVLFGDAEIPVYNNGILVESIIDFITRGFSNQQHAIQEVKSFMYEHNFGRNKTSNLTIDGLYDSICNKHIIDSVVKMDEINNAKKFIELANLVNETHMLFNRHKP